METWAMIGFTVNWLISVIFIVLLINSDNERNSVVGFIGAFIWLISFILFAANTENLHYKKGQIDALNNDYKYKMEVKRDTTYKTIN